MEIWIKQHYGWTNHFIENATSLADAAYKYIRANFDCLTDDNHTVKHEDSYIAIIKNEKSPLFKSIGNLRPMFDGKGVVWFDYKYSNKNPNHYYISRLNGFIRKKKISTITGKICEDEIFSNMEKVFDKKNFLKVAMEEFPDTIFYFKDNRLKMIEDINNNILLYHELSLGSNLIFKVNSGTYDTILKTWINFDYKKNFKSVQYIQSYHLKRYKCLKSTYRKRLKENTLNILA